MNDQVSQSHFHSRSAPQLKLIKYHRNMQIKCIRKFSVTGSYHKNSVNTCLQSISNSMGEIFCKEMTSQWWLLLFIINAILILGKLLLIIPPSKTACSSLIMSHTPLTVTVPLLPTASRFQIATYYLIGSFSSTRPEPPSLVDNLFLGTTPKVNWDLLCSVSASWWKIQLNSMINPISDSQNRKTDRLTTLKLYNNKEWISFLAPCADYYTRGGGVRTVVSFPGSTILSRLSLRSWNTRRQRKKTTPILCVKGSSFNSLSSAEQKSIKPDYSPLESCCQNVRRGCLVPIKSNVGRQDTNTIAAVNPLSF